MKQQHKLPRAKILSMIANKHTKPKPMKDSLATIIQHLQTVADGCDALNYNSSLKQYGDYTFKINVRRENTTASVWIEFASTIASSHWIMIIGNNVTINNAMQYLDDAAEALTDNMVAITHQMNEQRKSEEEKVRLQITKHQDQIEQLKKKLA